MFIDSEMVINLLGHITQHVDWLKNRFIMKIIFIYLIVMFSMNVSANTIGQKFSHLNIISFGSCEGKKKVNLENSLFIQNTQLVASINGSLQKIRIVGPVIYLEVKPGEEIFYPVDAYLGEWYKDRYDIELSFIYFENKIYVYWKETFKNRSYRQGVVDIHKGKLVSVCTGSGGFDAHD